MCRKISNEGKVYEFKSSHVIFSPDVEVVHLFSTVFNIKNIVNITNSNLTTSTYINYTFVLSL